jgi:hypothetical protein
VGPIMVAAGEGDAEPQAAAARATRQSGTARIRAPSPQRAPEQIARDIWFHPGQS